MLRYRCNFCGTDHDLIYYYTVKIGEQNGNEHHNYPVIHICPKCMKMLLHRFPAIASDNLDCMIAKQEVEENMETS